MNLEQSKAFLKALGAHDSQMKHDGKWLRCSCPLARYTHKSRKDSNPSFALSLSETEAPFFNCFSCLNGSAATLVQTLEMYASQDDSAPAFRFKDAHEILDGAELQLVQLPEYTEFGDHTYKKVTPWPQEWLDSFFHAENVQLAREYLTAPEDHLNEFGQNCRNFPVEMIQRFDVRYDHSRAMVVFPYRDVNGRLAGLRGRGINERRHYDYTWQDVNNANLVWYNEPVLQLDGWTVVVEGQLDAMRVAQGGYEKVVANLTAKATQHKLEKLISGGDGTILIPDNDETGTTSIARYKSFHEKHGFPFQILHLPEGIKDADQAHPGYLFDRITALTQ